MVERADRSGAGPWWRRLPPPRSRPVARVIALRLGLYVVLVALLVIVHPLEPVPMLVVATTIALVIVVAQQRWRLEPRATWDLPRAHRVQLLSVTLAIAGVAVLVVGVDDAVPRQVESLHSAVVFLGIAMVFVGAGLFESVARREGGAWYPASAVALVVLAGAYFLGLSRLGTGWWSWVPLVAVLAAPVFVGIITGWLITLASMGWHGARTDVRRGAVVCVVAGGLLAGARWSGVVGWWVVWWVVTWVPPLALLAMAPRRRTTVLLAVALVGIVVLPLALLHRYHLPAPQVWALAVLMLVVTLIAVDNNTDIVFIVVLAAVAWSGLPRSVPLDGLVRPDPGRPVMAALGDSFMSGEGAQRFYVGTNRRVRNECRRAPSAYPVRLAEIGRAGGAAPGQVLFLACSGATIDHLLSRPQFEDEPVGGPPRSQIDQLVALVDAHGYELDLVLVGIGGNDAGFGLVARTCFAPGPCEELAERWRRNLVDGLTPKLELALETIRATVPGARVVVVPYPVPIESHSCSDSTLTESEHRFLQHHTLQLNSVVGDAADRTGVEFAAEVQWALLDAGQALCGAGSESGVNWLDLNPVGGSLAQTVNPRNWFHNSLHPNEVGHASIAEALDRWLAGTATAARPHGTPIPTDAAPPDLPEICERPTPDDIDACERAWMFRHASAAMVGPSVVLLALVACYWWLAVELISWWRVRQHGEQR
jgi:lysophospholipase L1-like esterase